jgi:hypothetical protein
MSQFYDNLARTASGLLKTYGQEVKFTRSAVGAYDAATGTASTTASVFKAFGVVLEFKSGEIDGVSILSTDRKLILEQSSKLPVVNDVATVGKKDYVVVRVDSTNPAGTEVVTTCLLRTGENVSDLR